MRFPWWSESAQTTDVIQGLCSSGSSRRILVASLPWEQRGPVLTPFSISTAASLRRMVLVITHHVYIGPEPVQLLPFHLSRAALIDALGPHFMQGV